MATHEYYAQLGIDAGQAVKAFSDTAKTADGLNKSLTALHGALEQVQATSDSTAEKAGRSLPLYKKLADAVGAYGRASKTLADPNVIKGQQQVNATLASMRKELEKIGNAEGLGDKDKLSQISKTLDLYKQLAQAARTYSASLREEASAIKAVADAESRRLKVSQEAANAKTRGVDAWGVTKEERDLRTRYQTVLQAEKEMEAEFERRAREHLKASGLYARGEEPISKAIRQTYAATTAEERLAMSIRVANQQRENAIAQQGQYEQGLAATRYALYEVAATYTAVAAAAAALPVASTKAAIEMEAQFAHVARTTQATGAPLQRLRNDFVSLSTEIPVTFEELSKIGTLGAQMGIAVGDLESFSDTVAKFSATTDVSVDQAAMSFGRLSNMMQLTEADYRQLGASISELGTASVATESEILAIAESIATTANMAGFAEHQVVGLSTAMASLRIRPEMARGALQRIFAQINAAVADGSETLTSYAAALGTTEEAAANLWRNDPSQFFQRVAEAIGQLDDNIARSQFIREGLGLRNVRDVELLNRLANGYEVYADSMNLAADAYARGDYLEKEAGVIFETTAAALERLGSAFKGMLASFGGDGSGLLKGAIELLIDLLNAIRDMPQWAKNSALALAGLVAVFAGLRAGMALTMASMRAFRMVQRHIGVEGAVSLATLRREAALTFPQMSAALATVSAYFKMVRQDMRDATGIMAKTRVAAHGLRGALSAIGTGGWIGIILTGATALTTLAMSHESAAQKARQHAEALQQSMGGAEKVFAALAKDAEELASGVQAEPIAELTRELHGQAYQFEDTAIRSSIYVHTMGEVQTGTENATSAIKEQTIAIGEHTDALIRNALTEFTPPDSVNMDAINEAMERGFDFDRWLNLLYTQGQEGARRYAEGFNDRQWGEQGWGEEFFDSFKDYTDALGESVYGALVHGEALGGMAQSLGVDLEEMGEGAEAGSEGVDTLADSFDDLISKMFGLIDAEAGVYAALDRLGEAIDKNGESFDITTEAGRNNMEALRGVIEAVAKDISAQVEAGNMTAAAGAEAFAGYVDGLMSELAQMGVDTSQFDAFRTHLDGLFENPVVVGVDTEPAINALAGLQEYAQSVFEELRAQGVSKGMAASGARYSAQAYAAGVSEDGRLAAHQRRLARSRARAAASEARRQAEQYQSRYDGGAAAARARAEQERLNKELEKGNKTTRDTADQAKRLREEIKNASDEGRIFEETMKELSSAFKETLDRFGGHQAARDSMEAHLNAMRKAAQDAKEEVKNLREEAAKLRREAKDLQIEANQADIFAAVARRYGDDTRYEQYRNEAKNARASAKEKLGLAKTADREAAALDKNRLSLTGYSEQAIKNRDMVRQLQNEMADLILKYAETGATTEEVTAYAEGLRKKFQEQLTQMGYNREDVKKLSRVFIDLKGDIERVPREVRVRAKAEVDEAKRKLKELEKGRTVPVTVRATNKQLTIPGVVESERFNTNEVRANNIRGNNFEYGYGITSNWRRAGGGPIPGTYSGPLNKDDKLVVGPNGPEGSIRSAEWVMPVESRRHYGDDFMRAVQTMRYNPTVHVSAPSSSVQAVELLPHQINQLARAVSTVLAVDGKAIAATTNSQNARMSRRGV